MKHSVKFLLKDDPKDHTAYVGPFSPELKAKLKEKTGKDEIPVTHEPNEHIGIEALKRLLEMEILACEIGEHTKHANAHQLLLEVYEMGHLLRAASVLKNSKVKKDQEAYHRLQEAMKGIKLVDITKPLA